MIGIVNNVLIIIQKSIVTQRLLSPFQTHTMGAAKEIMDGSIKLASFIFLNLSNLLPFFLVNNKGSTILQEWGCEDGSYNQRLSDQRCTYSTIEQYATSFKVTSSNLVQIQKK